MAWSLIAANIASGIAGRIVEGCGGDKQTKNTVKAWTTGIVGGTTAVFTLDPVGGALVAYKTKKLADGEKGHIHPAVTGVALVTRLAVGDISLDPNDYTS